MLTTIGLWSYYLSLHAADTPEAIAIPVTFEPSRSRITIQMRGNISNRKSGKQSNRQAIIIKTTRTVLK